MKKLMKLLCACFLVLGLSGCGETIEDTNGDNNTALNTITREDVEGKVLTSSGLGYSESEFMGITSFKYEARNFNGVEEVFSSNYIYASRIDVSVHYINLESGNFRMYVLLDGKIIQEITSDEGEEIFSFDDIKGTLSVRVAGESAKVVFDFDVY